MPDARHTPQRWLRVALSFGALALVCYVISVPLSVLPPAINRYPFMAYGPLLAIAAYAFGHVMAARADSVSLRVAVMMLVVAGAFVSAMTVVQTVNFTVMGDRMDHAADPATRELLRAIMWGVNNVQGALDITLDIWFTVGGMFLAVAALGHPWFGRVLGWSGLVILVGLLFLNLYTFPYVPAESGLFDLGPLAGLWLGVVLVQAARMARREGTEGP